MNVASVFDRFVGRDLVVGFCNQPILKIGPLPPVPAPPSQRGDASFVQPLPCCRNATRVECNGVGHYFARGRRDDFGDFGFTVFGAGVGA